MSIRSQYYETPVGDFYHITTLIRFLYRTDAVPQQLLNGIHFQLDGNTSDRGGPSGYGRENSDPNIVKYVRRAFSYIQKVSPTIVFQSREEKFEKKGRIYLLKSLSVVDDPVVGPVLSVPTGVEPVKEISFSIPRKLSADLLIKNYEEMAKQTTEINFMKIVEESILDVR